MSKRGYISRYLLILKKIKATPFTCYEDLQRYIETQVDYLQMLDDTLAIGFSQRTLQRDLKEIRNIWGIDVQYSKSKKGYFIVQNEMETTNFQRMIEAFDLFSSLNLVHDLAPFIQLEKNKPQGTENLYGLLHAIKNKLQIRFDHQKFYDEKSTKRNVSPYALKEFKNRWYLLAKDNKDCQVKSFALDRLTELQITNSKFVLAPNYTPEDIYRNSFGIISPNGDEPSEIILSFDEYQGKYIKSLPLHHSQQIILDTEAELQIKLTLYITHDLIMELLSFGDSLKVLKPQSLAHQIKATLKKAYSQYL